MGKSWSTKDAEVRQELFLHGKVLHMNVDNLVERRARDGANSAKFNTMIRIAQFWCNGREWKSEVGKFFAQYHEGHRVVGRKEFRKWKTFAEKRLKREITRKTGA